VKFCQSLQNPCRISQIPSFQTSTSIVGLLNLLARFAIRRSPRVDAEVAADELRVSRFGWNASNDVIRPLARLKC
jgi:protoporphyrinogen oxidase